MELRVSDAGGRGEAVVIEDVREGSPAAEAGLRPGDLLLSINDLRGLDDLRELPERLALRVGDRVRVRVERDGRRREVVVRAAERPVDVRPRTIRLAADADALVESMVRSMDSVRVRLVELSRRRDTGGSPDGDPWLRARSAQRTSVSVPFEFFVFRGEEHDSLRRAMEDLNHLTEELRVQEDVLLAGLRRSLSRSGDPNDTDELRAVRASLEDVRRRSGELRAAMSEAARASAGFDYVRPSWSSPVPAPPQTPQLQAAPDPDAGEIFRPLTPYVMGSNRVAGAQVIDLRPELARYFDVDDGVLIVDVVPGTPTAIAGMLPGDVIIRIDQVGVRSVEELRFGISRAGESLPISLVRQGSTVEVLLRR